MCNQISVHPWSRQVNTQKAQLALNSSALSLTWQKSKGKDAKRGIQLAAKDNCCSYFIIKTWNSEFNSSPLSHQSSGTAAKRSTLNKTLFCCSRQFFKLFQFLSSSSPLPSVHLPSVFLGLWSKFKWENNIGVTLMFKKILGISRYFAETVWPLRFVLSCSHKLLMTHLFLAVTTHFLFQFQFFTLSFVPCRFRWDRISLILKIYLIIRLAIIKFYQINLIRILKFDSIVKNIIVS